MHPSMLCQVKTYTLQDENKQGIKFRDTAQTGKIH